VFVGHYGVSFATKRGDDSIPLWVLFVAVQLLDVVWAPLILLGVERVRIVPGFTATNPLDLYYMPYTHSLVAALLWSAAAAAGYRLLAHPRSSRVSLLVGLAVFSHWVLDFIVHRPDLPLYDNSAKVGLGLWNRPVLAFALEATFLLGGMAFFLRHRPGRRAQMVAFGLIMLAVQAYVFFGPPPASGAAVAATALGSYAAFALIIWWLADRGPVSEAA
jgi:drug/metabolite transporter superfamily protein YnfA